MGHKRNRSELALKKKNLDEKREGGKTKEKEIAIKIAVTTRAENMEEDIEEEEDSEEEDEEEENEEEENEEQEDEHEVQDARPCKIDTIINNSKQSID